MRAWPLPRGAAASGPRGGKTWDNLGGGGPRDLRSSVSMAGVQAESYADALTSQLAFPPNQKTWHRQNALDFTRL